MNIVNVRNIFNGNVKRILYVIDLKVKQHPIKVACLFSTTLGTSSNIMVQYMRYKYDTNELKDNFWRTIDMKQTAFFCLWAFGYHGIVQHRILVLMTKVGNRINSNFMRKMFYIGFDQGIHTPFMYFPAFYLANNMFYYQEMNIEYTLPTLNTMLSCWKVWIPAHFITFSMPIQYRLPWASLTSFCWTWFLMNIQMADVDPSDV